MDHNQLEEIATRSSITLLFSVGIVKYLLPRMSKRMIALDTLYREGVAASSEYMYANPLQTIGFAFGVAYINAKIENHRYTCNYTQDAANQENRDTELQEDLDAQLSPKEHFYFSFMGSAIIAGLCCSVVAYKKEFFTYPVGQKIFDFCEQRPVTAAVLLAVPGCYVQISKCLEDDSLESGMNTNNRPLI